MLNHNVHDGHNEKQGFYVVVVVPQGYFLRGMSAVIN